MDTSDDPVTLGLAAGGAILAEEQRKKASKRAANVEEEAAARTAALAAEANKERAEPVEQLSEQAKRNRRLAASALTREFAGPTLGIPALLSA